jgi:hypothetical protein
MLVGRTSPLPAAPWSSLLAFMKYMSDQTKTSTGKLAESLMQAGYGGQPLSSVYVYENLAVKLASIRKANDRDGAKPIIRSEPTKHRGETWLESMRYNLSIVMKDRCRSSHLSKSNRRGAMTSNEQNPSACTSRDQRVWSLITRLGSGWSAPGIPARRFR